jgi:hypothetical protein
MVLVFVCAWRILNENILKGFLDRSYVMLNMRVLASPCFNERVESGGVQRKFNLGGTSTP